MTNETILITIQVHNRLIYLKHLIESLRTAHDISSTLLIISNDVYDETLNGEIEKIDFCMVLQIFYPHSIQTHPRSFPGTDPKDCPRDASFVEARRMKCKNYKHPDSYGHYREAKFTQMKHHWWWKLNVIFDSLNVTKYHNGFLLLLEEDYYVAQDFVHVFRLLQQQILKSCTKCNVVSLGTYKEEINEKSFNIFDVGDWITNLHNMGMAFNRTTWRAIKNCAKAFCDYDEYNYDFSLQNVNRNCLKNELFVAIVRGPRIYHIGECGVHHTTNDCRADEKVSQVKESLRKAKLKHQLFPRVLKRNFKSLQAYIDIVANGGWGDKRDQKLCLEMTLDVS